MDVEHLEVQHQQAVQLLNQQEALCAKLRERVSNLSYQIIKALMERNKR